MTGRRQSANWRKVDFTHDNVGKARSFNRTDLRLGDISYLLNKLSSSDSAILPTIEVTTWK